MSSPFRFRSETRRSIISGHVSASGGGRQPRHSLTRGVALAVLLLALTVMSAGGGHAGLLAEQPPKPATGVFVSGAAPTGAVTNASVLLIDLVDMTDLMGFKVAVDGGTPIDVGMPTTQAPISGGGITFTISVSSLSLSNGSHVLTFYSYNSGGTLSSSPPTMNVTKS